MLLFILAFFCYNFFSQKFIVLNGKVYFITNNTVKRPASICNHAKNKNRGGKQSTYNK